MSIALKPTRYSHEFYQPTHHPWSPEDPPTCPSGFSPKSFDEFKRRGDVEVFGGACINYKCMHPFAQSGLTFGEMEKRYANPYLLICDLYTLMRGFYSYLFDINTAVTLATHQGERWNFLLDEYEYVFEKIIENSRENLPTHKLQREFDLRSHQEDISARFDIEQDLLKYSIERIKKKEMILKRDQDDLDNLKTEEDW